MHVTFRAEPDWGPGLGLPLRAGQASLNNLPQPPVGPVAIGVRKLANSKPSPGSLSPVQPSSRQPLSWRPKGGGALAVCLGPMTHLKGATCRGCRGGSRPGLLAGSRRGEIESTIISEGLTQADSYLYGVECMLKLLQSAVVELHRARVVSLPGEGRSDSAPEGSRTPGDGTRVPAAALSPRA